MTNMPSSVIPAPIQYVVSLVTLPLVRSKAFPMSTITKLRQTMNQKLHVEATNKTFCKNGFEIHVGIHAPPPNGIISFQAVCMELGVDWSKVEYYLGNTANLHFVLTPRTVVAIPSRITLWQAEKPSLPSYGLGLLGIKQNSTVQIVARDVPPTPILNPLDLSGDTISPLLTPKTSLQLSIASVLPPPSPVESESSLSDDESHFFSDVSSSATDSSDEEDNEPILTTAFKCRKTEAILVHPSQSLVLNSTAITIKSYKYSDGETHIVSGGVKLGMPSVAYRHPDMKVDEDEWDWIDAVNRKKDSPATVRPIPSQQHTKYPSGDYRMPKVPAVPRKNSQRWVQKGVSGGSGGNEFNFPIKGTTGVSGKTGNWRSNGKGRFKQYL